MRWLLNLIGRFSYGRGFADGFDEGQQHAHEEMLGLVGEAGMPAADSEVAHRRHVLALEDAWKLGSLPERVCADLPCQWCGPIRSDPSTKEN